MCMRAHTQLSDRFGSVMFVSFVHPANTAASTLMASVLVEAVAANVSSLGQLYIAWYPRVNSFIKLKPF